jgi:hypothetical protein
MRARDLQEGPVDSFKKGVSQARKAASKAIAGDSKKSKEHAIKPAGDPATWEDTSGDLKKGVKVQYANRTYMWNGRRWVNQKTQDPIPTNSAAHQRLMKSVGRKPNGSKLPEYPNILAKAKAWWDGKHGEFGVAARQEKSPFVKAAGLAGAAIDRLRARRDDEPKDENPKPDPDRAAALKKAVDDSSPLEESGSVEGVGLIHLSEIEPTLSYLEDKTGLDLINNTLGSVGKKTWSGDIDVAVDIDPKDPQQMSELIDRLSNVAGLEKVQRLPGGNITSRVKIQQYDDTIENDDGRPRTGYVQVDFMPGEPGLMKMAFHSPAQGESRYKGAIRTIMLGTLAGYWNREESKERLPDGRPLRVSRYKFGKNGLIRFTREPAPRKDGQGYTKANIDTIEQVWKDPVEVARELNLGGAEALNSFESLLKAIENRWPRELVEKVKEDMRNNATVQEMGVPEELED